MSVVVIDLLTKYLGIGTKRKDGNYAFYCPFCNHPKQKLEVDTILTESNKGNWKCWVCNTKGRNLVSLLKKLHASKSDLDLLPSTGKISKPFVNINFSPTQEVIKLPIGYIPLTGKETDLDVRYVLRKLFDRGLSVDDILKYKIGYISSGVNKYSTVIPSYDCEGVLNYFILKNFKTNIYLNPPISKDKIIFELFINWSLDLVLVEGVFDAFAVQRNVTPLLGKTMSPILKSRIASMSAKNVYICLDGGETQAMYEIADYIVKVGKTPLIVNLPNGEDPSSIGKHEIGIYLSSASKVNTSNLFYSAVLNKLK